MININNKVNPRNGVDFSRIRKHAYGGNIMKFQKPASGIIYTKPQASWHDSVFSNFKGDLFTMLSNPELTPELKNQLVAEINSMQDTYGNYRGKYENSLGSVMFDSEVEAYLNLINSDDYKFVNTKGISGGHADNRYTYIREDEKLRGNKDNANAGWKADGYWGAQTNDRTLLGYRGDFTDELLASWNKELATTDLETYLDGNVYKLRRLSHPVLNLEDSIQDTVQTNLENSYQPVTFQKPFQFKKDPFTAWIPSMINHYLTKKAINTLLSNELQKKVPLAEALHQDYTITDNKATTDAYNQAGANIQNQANRIASQSSNLELNQAMLLEGARLGEEQRLQGQLAKTQGYNQSIKEAQLVANLNNQLSVATANTNRQNLVIDWNSKLNAKSQAAILHATNNQNLVNNISGDYSRYIKDLRLNAYDAIRHQNDYQASLDEQKAQEGFLTKVKNPMETSAFNNIYNLVWSADYNPEDLIYKEYITSNDVEGLDDATKRKNLYDWLNANSSTTWGKQWVTDYGTEITAAKDLANLDIAKIKSNQARTRQYIPLMISDLGIFRTKDIDPNAYYQSIYSHKEGGTLSAKNGSRMVRYMEHKRKTAQDKKKNDLAVLEMNRKARADLRKQEQQAAKQLQESLKRELESLDRETLLLLRSVFK